jgi:hypothetical protein
VNVVRRYRMPSSPRIPPDTCPPLAHRGTAECTAQCERVCLDDHLRPFVDRCCNCKTVCELDETAKLVAMGITLLMLV